ncbi:MAG: transcription antitermination factor NusB [Myxococcota bacterium]|jgi:N utilization substance protein B|nr:transcription antitermination factor NusB [Myxococcota bacterium]
MATRRRAREVALQMLFQSEMSGASAQETVGLYRACFAEGPFPDPFSIGLFEAVMARRDEIDVIIERSSENWRIDRMSRVDRNILRIGVQEITAGEEIPVRVAINEAVELAKRFSTQESAAFVNGILDRVARDEKRL